MKPNPRNKKPPKQPNYLKRRTFAEGKAQVDAAHVATWRLYCEVLAPLSERGLQTAPAPHGRAGRPPHARPAERAARRAAQGGAEGDCRRASADCGGGGSLSASRLSIAAGYRSPRRACSPGCAVAGGAMAQSMPGW